MRKKKRKEKWKNRPDLRIFNAAGMTIVHKNSPVIFLDTLVYTYRASISALIAESFEQGYAGISNRSSHFCSQQLVLFFSFPSRLSSPLSFSILLLNPIRVFLLLIVIIVSRGEGEAA